jgi:hypothetical protein
MTTQLLVDENVARENWAKLLSITQAGPKRIQTNGLFNWTCLFSDPREP